MGNYEGEINSKEKWNLRNLEPPPTTTHIIQTPIDLSALRSVLQIAIDFFDQRRNFKEDIDLLSRTVYRMKNKFRTDKGFKFMYKLNRSLKKYLEINIDFTIKNFHELLPRIVSSGSYVPNRNMFDYIVVRLQSLAAIMKYVVRTAKEAAGLIEQRIAIGHFWKVAFFAYALISRIWVISNEIMWFCCGLHKSLLPMRNILTEGSNNWIGDDYEFPKDLEIWLNVKDEGRFRGEIMKVFPQEIQREVESEYEDIISEEILSNNTLPKQKSTFELMMEDEGMLESIERVEIRTTKMKKKKKPTKSKKVDIVSNISSENLINNIGSFDVLNVFLKKENNARLSDRNSCVFKQLDGLQWNMLKRKIGNCCDKASAVKLKQKNGLLRKAKNLLKRSLIN